MSHPMTENCNNAADEAELRRLLAKWSRALEAKDLDRLLEDYADDALLYDAIPPYKVVGLARIRQAGEQCLPCFPATFQSEHRDIAIQADGDVAFVHCLHHFIPTPPEHPCGSTWMRVTLGLRRVGGAWKVLHEHVSIPFNPLNGQAWYVKDPEVVDMPDYGQPTEPVCSRETNR